MCFEWFLGVANANVKNARQQAISQTPGVARLRKNGVCLQVKTMTKPNRPSQGGPRSALNGVGTAYIPAKATT